MRLLVLILFVMSCQPTPIVDASYVGRASYDALVRAGYGR